jgi:hypothetical protein
MHYAFGFALLCLECPLQQRKDIIHSCVCSNAFLLHDQNSEHGPYPLADEQLAQPYNRQG